MDLNRLKQLAGLLMEESLSEANGHVDLEKANNGVIVVAFDDKSKDLAALAKLIGARLDQVTKIGSSYIAFSVEGLGFFKNEDDAHQMLKDTLKD